MQAQKQEKALSPNKEDIRRHIDFLLKDMNDFRDAKIEISYGDLALDNAPRLAEHFFIETPEDIQKIVDFAAEKNAEGRNIYIIGSLLVPILNPQQRAGDEKFYATNSVWVDIDNKPTDEKPSLTSEQIKEKYKECPPHMVVVTGRIGADGKPHLRLWLWWKLMEPLQNGEAVSTVLAGLIDHFDGDKSAKNPARLTRLGGCIAWPTEKKKGRIPEMVEVAFPKSPVISLERLIHHYPKKTITTKKPKSSLLFSSFTNPPEHEIREMLSFLKDIPDGPREPWLHIGMALHNSGYDFNIWNDLSKISKPFPVGKYDYDNCVREWNSFKPGGGITLGTLIKMASDAGYTRVSEVMPEPPPAAAAPQPEPDKPGPASPPEPLFYGLIADTLKDLLSNAQQPHPELALFNILTALGAIFGRRYATKEGTRTNIYAVGIAPTGSGKDFSRKYIKSLMLSAGLETFLGSDAIVSGAGILTALQKAPSQIMHIDEFGMFLSAVNGKDSQPYLKVCKKIITHLYSDSGGIYYGGQYAKKDEDPIKIISPNLCIYGTTTLDNYVGAMDKSVIASGELNRFLVTKPAVEWPDLAERASGNPQPSPSIVEAWRQLAPVFGSNNPLMAPEKITVTWDWLEDRIVALKKFEISKMRSNTITSMLWGRYTENIKKIAMILAIVNDQVKPNIEAIDLDTAEMVVTKSIIFMESLATDHMADSPHEKMSNKILEIIKKYGKKISKNELTNRTRELEKRQRDNALETLEERGAIRIEKEDAGKGGRPKYFIIAL